MDKYTGHAEEFELEDFQSLTIEEAASELDQLGLKYQISNYIFTDSVLKGTIFKQSPIPGTFVKKGRTIYFTVNRSSSQKFEIPNVYNKSEREATNQLGYYFELELIKSENYNPNLTVKKLESPPGYILEVGKDSLIKGSKIYVYLEFDEDDYKTNKKSVYNLQSIDSTIIE